MSRSSQRTLEQNAKMWAMLDEIADAGILRDQHWNPEQWKAIFMQSLGHPVTVLPTLDGNSWFPISLSTSRLTIEQMSELIECMLAWGTENGIVFKAEETMREVVFDDAREQLPDDKQNDAMAHRLDETF
jgi:hypothetical protein